MQSDKEIIEETIPETLKLEINNLIWMYSPGHVRLDEAEELAIKICRMIVE